MPKKLLKCPVPRASVRVETSHQENGFHVESAPIASTPAGLSIGTYKSHRSLFMRFRE